MRTSAAIATITARRAGRAAALATPSASASGAAAARRARRSSHSRQAASSSSATSGPRPTEARVSEARQASTAAPTSGAVRRVLRWATSSQKELTARAAPHRMASWYTQAFDVSSRGTEVASASTFTAARKVRPGPRGRLPSRKRATHTVSRVSATTRSSSASSSDTRVSRPSKRDVIATSGMRTTAGTGPK